MTGTIEGRAWKFGDNIDTDLLAPVEALRMKPEEGKLQCLESVDPDFAKNVATGDVFVAGDSLGIGSSREQAPNFLKLLGIRAIVAKSFARIFYRNALNLGLPPLVCADADRITAGDELKVDPVAGRIENVTTGASYACEPIPAHLMEMVADGGLLPHLKKKLGSAA